MQIAKCCMAAAVLLCMASLAPAATLSVNCGAKVGLTTIDAALKLLQQSEEVRGTNTSNVAGACRRNIRIQRVAALTRNAVSGASITAAFNRARDVSDADHSLSFPRNGSTVSGGCDAIGCYYGACCALVGRGWRRLGTRPGNP